jgi:signal transduction histidine kinase/CheY-like chemotaxis protein
VHPTGAEGPLPDAALTALVRGLVLQLEVDVAMISLLDDHMQYFLAGAEKDNIDFSEVTLESSKWYACDEVIHHGGLCERTIAIDVKEHPSAIYEELDMARNDRTKNLPFVNGAIAGFFRYAGAPIVTEAGLSIGTVFVMDTRPSSRLNAAQRRCLTETAGNVMRQLTQAVQALEGGRMMRYHSASASLLQQRTSSSKLPTNSRRLSEVGQYPDSVSQFYKHAAETMRKSFGFDGVYFKGIPVAYQSAQNTSGSRKGHMLATSLKAGVNTPAYLAASDMDRLVKCFPHGTVLYQLNSDHDRYFASSSSEHPDYPSHGDGFAVGSSFQNACQVLFMPLYDTLHNKTAAVCIGWLNDHSRVYSESGDLSFMSTFCTTTISEVLRLESHRLDQVKSDFLGSVSHEMRSPLHNTLGNLELLLQTDCSEEQHRLAVNARFGTTQLLETIDKILQYTSTDCAPEVTQRAALEQHGNKTQDGTLRIGPQSEHTASASGTVDLISLCEEVVEDITKRMRLLETIMSPTRYQKIDESTWPVVPQAPSEAADSDPFSMVLFDARSTDNLQLREGTAFGIILENLLVTQPSLQLLNTADCSQSNAIKHTRPGCCVRVCLEISLSTANLVVSDCGNGISEDFVENNLYVPFAQQDPVVSGIGLGLSLIKQNVDKHGGTVHFDTDRSLGTTATVSFQVGRLASLVNQGVRNDAERQNGTATIPPLPKRPTEDLPILKACFYAPNSWIRRYDKRDERSIDLVYHSLTNTLSEWFQPVLSIWQHRKDHTPPDLMFVSQQDLATFQEQCGQKFANVKKVVICAAVGSESARDQQKIKEAASVADAVIIGPVSPSKLWKVVTTYFPHVLPPKTHNAVDGESLQKQKDLDGLASLSLSRYRDHGERDGERKASNSSSGAKSSRSDHTSPQPMDRATKSPSRTPGSYEKTVDLPSASERSTNVDVGMDSVLRTADVAPGRVMSPPPSANKLGKATSSDPGSVSPTQSIEQPRFLLVDDNTINLRMLEMFVKKCGIPSTNVTSVNGGQKAIAAFGEALFGDGGGAPSFDIILMDLTMPEVSGFSATRSIRRIEDASNIGQQAYVVALTSLVSSKDRSAAYEVGVDDYITKPAGLKMVHEVIDTWRNNKPRR